MSFKLNIKVFSKPKRQLEQKGWDILGEARKICEFEFAAGKGLCHGFCARKLWNAGRAKELPGSIFPASALQPLSCMIRDPPSLRSSPCPALPVPPWAQPYLLRAGRARQQEWHLIPAARDLGSPSSMSSPIPAFRGAGSWEERDVPPSPAPRVCSCSQHPWDSLCLYMWVSILGYCVYFRVYYEHIWL